MKILYLTMLENNSWKPNLSLLTTSNSSEIWNPLICGIFNEIWISRFIQQYLMVVKNDENLSDYRSQFTVNQIQCHVKLSAESIR